MAQANDQIPTPKVMRYGVMVGLTITVFWIVAAMLATNNRSGWLLVLTAIYSVLLMIGVAKAQSESDKLFAMRKLLRDIKASKEQDTH